MPPKNLLLTEKELSKLRELDSYSHDDSTRPNNPQAGLASHDSQSDSLHTYKFDANLSPSLEWSGKAENESFTVPVSSIHVHETVNPLRVINSVQRVTPKTQEQQLLLFPEASPLQRILEQQAAIEAYRHPNKWQNRLIAGDSLIVMNSLLQKESMQGQVQTAYIDPPYGIKYGSNFQPFINKRDVKDKSDDDLTQEPEMIKAFRDTWELGIHSYLSYLQKRLLLVRELLSDSGSVFVQISDENVHHVREICDEVFGSENFVTMIKFRKSGSQAANLIASTTDYIIWYAKDKSQVKYRQLYVERKPGTPSFDMYNYIELEDGSTQRLTQEDMQRRDKIIKGRKFQLTSLYSSGSTGNFTDFIEFEGEKFFAPTGRHWKTTIEGMKRLIAAGRVSKSGKILRYKRYIDDLPVMLLDDFWDDTGGTSDMKYVVQTSTKVIQRCILMTSDPNDLVLDITCGSGTTAYVAEQWGRRWITCDTSRVAIAIARQRLLTASYDYYELANPESGISGGFEYESVPHVTLKSIANNEKPSSEILYDKPVINKKKVRVTGAFTVEALPAPVVFSVDEAADLPDYNDEGAKQSDWREQMLSTGIIGRNGERMNFTRIDPLPGAKWLSAEAWTDDGKKVFISFANESSLMDTRRVYGAFTEAVKLPYDAVIFAAFQFDPEASQMISTIAKTHEVKLLSAQMNPDLMTEDLKRKINTDQSFWFVGQPDVELERVNGSFRVRVTGFDYYNVSSNRVESGNADKIAMWMLDTDYNGMSINPSQIFFPIEGKSGGWSRLAKTLRAEIDLDMIEKFSGTESLPFEAESGRKIAVKIIDDRGIESMRVLEISE